MVVSVEIVLSLIHILIKWVYNRKQENITPKSLVVHTTNRLYLSVRLSAILSINVKALYFIFNGTVILVDVLSV